MTIYLFLFAAFEAANFQIDFFGNPVMRTSEQLSDATLSLLLKVGYNAIPPPVYFDLGRYCKTR